MLIDAERDDPNDRSQHEKGFICHINGVICPGDQVLQRVHRLAWPLQIRKRNRMSGPGVESDSPALQFTSISQKLFFDLVVLGFDL